MSELVKKVRNIVEGWGNYAFKNELIERMAYTRAKICATCDHLRYEGWVSYIVETKEMKAAEGHVCGVCNCPLSGKLRVPTEKCPHPDNQKW